MTGKQRDASGEFAPVLCIAGSSPVRLWSHTPAERARRQFAREGVTRVVSIEEARRHSVPVIVMRADAVLDQPLIGILKTRLNIVLIGEGPAGPLPLAAHVRADQVQAAADILGRRRAVTPDLLLIERRPDELDVNYWNALRKRETPYALQVTEANQPDVEWRMFLGTYKGATDIVTKHLWPVPAFHVTRFLAPRGITPNMVTMVAFVLVFATFWLFLEGYYGLGLVSAWLMTFLDTVDGKLARTTLTSSKCGDIFDHGIDLIHPPFWYAAWGLGLGTVGMAFDSYTLNLIIGTILGGYILQRIMEGIAARWFGFHIHIWRPIDTLFRQITARRNPNLIILTVSAIAGRPDIGLLAVAAWTLICLVLHAIQLGQAALARRAGPLTSWMTRPR